MAFYRVCPACGANLDPCERCGCSVERDRTENKQLSAGSVGMTVIKHDPFTQKRYEAAR